MQTRPLLKRHDPPDLWTVPRRILGLHKHRRPNFLQGVLCAFQNEAYHASFLPPYMDLKLTRKIK